MLLLSTPFNFSHRITKQLESVNVWVFYIFECLQQICGKTIEFHYGFAAPQFISTDSVEFDTGAQKSVYSGELGPPLPPLKPDFSQILLFNLIYFYLLYNLT